LCSCSSSCNITFLLCKSSRSCTSPQLLTKNIVFESLNYNEIAWVQKNKMINLSASRHPWSSRRSSAGATTTWPARPRASNGDREANSPSRAVAADWQWPRTRVRAAEQKPKDIVGTRYKLKNDYLLYHYWKTGNGDQRGWMGASNFFRNFRPLSQNQPPKRHTDKSYKNTSHQELRDPKDVP
jgi:hypothetical protein